MIDAGFSPIVEFGVGSAGLSGQPESGDVPVVKENHNGVLVSAIDGLGHGTEAAAAAKLAAQTLDEHSGESVIRLVQMCHERLIGTRGAVMALARIDPRNETLTWLSIGNVDSVLIRANENLKPESPEYEKVLMRPGVVGYRLPPLSATMFSIARNDLVILATDGIRNDYVELINAEIRQGHPKDLLTTERTSIRHGTSSKNSDTASNLLAELSGSHGPKIASSPQIMAEYLCKNFSKGNDDALAVVVRYIGR